MLFETEKLEEIRIQIDLILEKILEYENRYKNQISSVHPNYTESAINLIHYLALRSFDNDVFQDKLNKIGLSNTSSSESSVLHNLLVYKTIINRLLNNNEVENTPNHLTKSESKQLLKKHANDLFGAITRNRRTRILVTQPTIAAEDPNFAKNLTDLGMDTARINCAHDSETVWSNIIANTKKANPNCKILMDLGGPKLRTGKMKPGHKVIHIKPKRNTLGQVTVPAKVWLAPFGMLPPENTEVDAIIPVNKKWLQKTRKGSYITFLDSRNKKCKITIEDKQGFGRWASCSDSAFVTTGTQLTVFLEKKSTSEIHTVHEILPLEEVIFLFEGDTLKLNKEPILGEPAKYNKAGELIEVAHISCTLPQLFAKVKKGELIYFDDGKIEGIIIAAETDFLLVEITNAKKRVANLKPIKELTFQTVI